MAWLLLNLADKDYLRFDIFFGANSYIGTCILKICDEQKH